MSSSWKINYSRYKRFFTNTISTYRKRRDTKAYLEMFLSLATVSIFAIFALKPTLSTIAKLINEVEIKQQTITTMDTKIQNLKKARELYEKEQEKIQLLNEAVPQNALPDAFVRQIEGASSDSLISVNLMSIGKTVLLDQDTPTTPSKNKKEGLLPENSENIAFNINANADYLSLIKFIATLEKLRRPIKIDSLTIDADKKNDGNTLILGVSGKTPFLKKIKPDIATPETK